MHRNIIDVESCRLTDQRNDDVTGVESSLSRDQTAALLATVGPAPWLPGTFHSLDSFDGDIELGHADRS
jgi:hypothetical protein